MRGNDFSADSSANTAVENIVQTAKVIGATLGKCLI
jgi:hypothetical protein